MCGRFSFGTQTVELGVLAGIPVSIKASFNVAPTHAVPAIAKGSKGTKLAYLHWGLIPRWAKDSTIAAKTINARSETVAEKPSFRESFTQRRCLIIADGFYEWKRASGKKQPWRICQKDRKHFTMAGLWDSWKTPSGESIHSCTVITCPPNDVVSTLHDRMPVVLDESGGELWLDKETPESLLHDLMSPSPAHLWEKYEVSSRINNVRNNDKELLDPVPSAEQLSLL